MNGSWDTLVNDIASRLGISVELVKAVIAAESGGNPKAYRNEPKIGDASRGLMQVLYRTAQQMGYTGAPEGLFDPSTSVEFGARYLRYQLLRYAGDTASAVAAYNAGAAYRKSDGTFVNQAYVDRVMRFYNQYLQESEAEKTTAVQLRTDLPQLGPVPSYVPVALSATDEDQGKTVSLETFLTSETAPWVVALGGAALLAFLTSRR